MKRCKKCGRVREDQEAVMRLCNKCCVKCIKKQIKETRGALKCLENLP